MVVAFGFRDAKADGDHVVPGCIGNVRPAGVVVIDVEPELVAPNPERPVGQ
jgi:hypothetical protein